MGVFTRGSRRACAVLLVGAIVAPLLLSGPASAATPVASFDWSMPDRFGPDRNGDGLTDYVDGASDHVTGYDATPDSWHVDLDACASTGAATATYQWTVVDQPNPATPITVQGGPGCDDFFMDVPEEGSYRVDLVVTSNGVQSAPLRRDVVVQDWLIVSVGDSYGSGEGAPDIPIDQSQLAETQAAWEAHRAALEQLFTLQTSLQPVQDEIALWQDALDRAAYFCDPTRHDADAIKCAQALADAAIHGASVIGQLIFFGISVVGETIVDAVNAIGAAFHSAAETVEGALQVANSFTGQLSATWQAERCHRSANAGSAQAARALELADPHTSVTFVHLACSGATMTYGLLGWYQGTEHPDTINNAACNPADPATRPAECIPPQVQIAKNIVGSREVDATYVSIGGNDAHFADIVAACIVQDDCRTPSGGTTDQMTDHLCGDIAGAFGLAIEAVCRLSLANVLPVVPSAAELIAEGITGSSTDPAIPGLANGYNSLAPTLVGSGGLLPAGRANRVFLSQYVDAVKSDDGTLCDFDTMGYESIPGMSATESAFIDSTVIPTLFGAIEGATQAHGWTYVDGVYDGFTNHGYCADDHYMVRAHETFLNEGRFQGLVHPNTAGYAVYRDAILSKWLDQMYPNGAVGGARRPDQRPYVDAGSAVTVAEGQSTTLGSSIRDSDGDTVSVSWTHDRPNKITISPASSVAPTLAGKDDTTGTATMTATDTDGSRTDTVPFTVTNVAPVIGSLSSLYNPVPLGTALNAFVPYTDAGVWDTHTARFDWGDGTAPTTALGVGGGGTGGASAYHTYAAPGLYPVTITVTDDDGGSATAVHEFVVVYDGSGGFATGGGWFQSPSGAYTPSNTTDPDVTGPAHFAFLSKYARGASVPSGTTAFRFDAGDLDFESTSYDWMVVSGTKATYRGTGKVNGVAGYRFMLVANDGSSQRGGVDQLRVRIWNDATGVLVYDNQMGAALDAGPTTAISGGQITVHR